MKAGWTYKTLGDVVEKGSSNLSLKQIKDDEGGYPVYGAKGFIKNVSFYHQDFEYLAIIKDGAGIGRVSRHPKHSSVLATMQYLIPREGFDIRFVEYFLKSIDYDKYRTGSTIPHIYFKDYKSEPFPIVPLPQQKRIVAILDEAYSAIDKAQLNTHKNLESAQLVFESELESTFNCFESGWVRLSLDELCSIKHGFAFKSRFFVDRSHYVVLTPGSFYEHGGFRDQGEKTKYYEGDIPEGYVLDEGDFLFAMTEQAVGLLGSTLIVPESGRYLHNQRLGLVNPYPGVDWDNRFFFHQFNTKAFRRAVQGSASGVKVRHTSPKKLGAIPVLNAPIEDQRRIAERLDHLLDQCRVLADVYSQKCRAYLELKESILQRAFSGELTDLNTGRSSVTNL